MRTLLIASLLLTVSTACRNDTDNDEDGVPDWADCNDDDSAVGPSQTEVCNGIDDDCDGQVDDDASDATMFYADGDAALATPGLRSRPATRQRASLPTALTATTTMQASIPAQSKTTAPTPRTTTVTARSATTTQTATDSPLAKTVTTTRAA